MARSEGHAQIPAPGTSGSIEELPFLFVCRLRFCKRDIEDEQQDCGYRDCASACGRTPRSCLMVEREDSHGVRGYQQTPAAGTSSARFMRSASRNHVIL